MSWETEVALYLRKVEYACEKIESAAREIHHAVLVLESRPDFETRAQAGLLKAQENLHDIIARLMEAAAHYERVPVTSNQEKPHAVQAS